MNVRKERRMNTVDVLERAIKRLEELKAVATPGPWIARYDGGVPWEVTDEDDIPDEVRVGGGRWVESPGVYATTDVLMEIDSFSVDADEFKVVDANVELVTALSRTVDPILDLLRAALADFEQYGDAPSQFFKNDVALARAILGEVEQ